jgi:Tol biopolymer transport system component
VVAKIQPVVQGYRSEIIVMDVVNGQGENAQRVTNTSTGNGDIGNNRGSAALNNEEIVFTRGNEIGLRKLLVMDLDGGNVHSISTLFPESMNFGFVPTVSASGQVIVIDGRLTSSDLQDLYMTDPEGQTLVNITNTPDVIENHQDLR